MRTKHLFVIVFALVAVMVFNSAQVYGQRIGATRIVDSSHPAAELPDYPWEQQIYLRGQGWTTCRVWTEIDGRWQWDWILEPDMSRDTRTAQRNVPPPPTSASAIATSPAPSVQPTPSTSGAVQAPVASSSSNSGGTSVSSSRPAFCQRIRQLFR